MEAAAAVTTSTVPAPMTQGMLSSTSCVCVCVAAGESHPVALCGCAALYRAEPPSPQPQRIADPHRLRMELLGQQLASMSRHLNDLTEAAKDIEAGVDQSHKVGTARFRDSPPPGDTP